MDLNSGLLTLILLINIPGSLTTNPLHVKCDHVCALRETNVTLKCTYSNINIKTGFWFSEKQSTNWRKKDEPEDLTLDSDYSGRVNQRITDSQSQLTIRDLRERDSGEYQLMFIMKDGVKHLSSVTVSLTVTVLQVRKELRNQRVHLTCDTSCTLTSRPRHFYWKKDGQYIIEIDSKTITVPSSKYAAYSCFLTPDLKNSSDPVCLSERCWNVTYTSRRVCALVGSTVDIHSTHSHPTGYTVEKTFWHLIGSEGFVDLREDQQFAGRVEYVGNTLRIKDVNMSDSGEYRLRIITNGGPYSGSPGVILTVTDTQVISSPDPVIEGEKVILSCSTKCTLDNKYTYIWYKNGQQVTDGFTLLNKLYLESVSSEELQEYSCDVREIQSTDEGPEKNMATWKIILILSVLLILVLIGVLLYRRRKNNSSQICENVKKGVQPDSSTVDTAAPPSTDFDFTDVKEQDIHYSSVNFKQSPKTTSTSPTSIYSSAEDVQYATLKLK